MTHIQHFIRIAPLACAIAALMLTARSSGSSGSGSSPNPSPNDTTGVTPTGKVANGGSNTVMATGQAVGSLGSILQSANIPGLSDQTKVGLGGVVGNVGKAASDLDLGVRTGLGKVGQNPNSIGTTVASTDNVMTDLDQAAVSVDSLVQGLSQSLGAPLAPITQPVGGGVQQADQASIGGGTLLGNALSSDAVQQVAQQLSTTIVPITTQISGATQMVGGSTGLDGALSNLLGTVGGDVVGAGNTVTGTGVLVVSNLGPVITSLGATVTTVGDVTATGGSAGGNSLGSLLGGVGGSTSGSNPLTPLTGLLDGAGGSNPLAPVAGALGGMAGGNSPLAPITGLLGGVASTTSGASGGNPLAPVTNLLDGISSPVH